MGSRYRYAGMPDGAGHRCRCRYARHGYARWSRQYKDIDMPDGVGNRYRAAVLIDSKIEEKKKTPANCHWYAVKTDHQHSTCYQLAIIWPWLVFMTVSSQDVNYWQTNSIIPL